ncbi:MAG: site-specific integrase, partial [Oscillospiraceae bacterium]
EQDERIYSVEQMELIKRYALSHRFGYEVRILIDTGIRRGELLGLPWKYVDLEKNVIYIRQAASLVKENGKMRVIIDSPKTATSVRDIPISSELSRILAEQKKRARGEFVVSSSSGSVCNPRTWQRRHYDVFMNDMQCYYRNEGIDIPIYTPHRLRHSRTSEWVNADCNLFAVAKTLGHSDLAMIRKKYAHSDVEKTRRLLNIS